MMASYDRWREPKNLVKAAVAVDEVEVWTWEPLLGADDEFAEFGAGTLYGFAPTRAGAPMPSTGGVGAAVPGAHGANSGYGIHHIMEEAEAIIRDAQAEADRLLAEAKARAHHERERIYHQALERAREEVSNSADPAWPQSLEELKAAAAALGALTEQLRRETRERLAKVEAQTLETAFEIAEKVIAHELSTRPEAVVDSLRAALARLADSDVTVRLNPADMPVVQQALLELQSERSVGDMLSFEEDTRVERGGCIVSGEHGSVDARPSTKLAQLRELSEG